MKGHNLQSSIARPHPNTLPQTPKLRRINDSAIISLTTDFGLSDWFVGTMKGVILGINPQASIIDITHELPPGDIRAGAFVLAASYRFFPKGTVHVAVVDPGVGTQRQAIAVQTSKYFFVGPDNGVLSWTLRKEKIRAIYLLENGAYFLREISQTFHGRDIFAPVAAHLSCGIAIRQMGRVLKDLVRIDWPRPRRRRNRVEGEVVYLDRFGNAITNIEREGMADLVKRKPSVCLRDRRLCRLGRFYQSVAKGTPTALFGSGGFLEIAINGGSTGNELSVRVGDPVSVFVDVDVKRLRSSGPKN